MLPFLFIFLPLYTQAGKETLNFSKNQLLAQQALYQFETGRVRSLLQKEHSSAVSLYLLEMTRLFEEMLGCSAYSGTSADLALQQIARASEHPNKGLLTADLYMYSAINAALNNENIAASASFYKAWTTLRHHREQYPDENFNRKFILLIGAYVHVAPERFQWLARQSGLSIPPVKAIRELDELSQQPITRPEQKAWQLESSVFSVFLTHYGLKQGTGAFAGMKRLIGNELSNPMHCFLFNAMALQTGNSKYIPSQMQEKFYRQLPYLAYQNGMAKLHALDSSAILCFRQFLMLQKGGHLVKSTWHKLSWMAVLYPGSADYAECVKQCRSQAYAIREEDRYALRQCEESERPDPILLKLRLLYDGGRISEAYELAIGLHHEQFKSLSDKTEYLYRKGRIAEAKGLTETARRFYTACAETGSKQPTYYACKSCLLIAAMYRKSGNCEEARKWYVKAAENTYVKEYRSALMEEAKNGLDACR